ncbi:MAG: GIY-YIG nuclease family protein [Sarcina sp.]
MNYTYILECSDKTLYTGWTNNLEKRIKVHNNGKGSKYTRGRIPVKMVYYEIFNEKTQAQKREYAIKKMKKSEKVELINRFKEE